MKNIWAVGRNYADHAKELGNSVPEKPMIFLKAGSCAHGNDHPIRLIRELGMVHAELEVALRFGPDLQFDAVTLALDLTARQVQEKLKADRHPWTLAKSFTGSCPMGPWTSITAADLERGFNFRLIQNDKLKQTGDTSQMIHSFNMLREYLVRFFPLCPGDCLLTGTPAGVGAISPGDRLLLEMQRPSVSVTFEVVDA